MDFSRVELDAEHQALLEEIRAFMAENVTPEVIEHERVTGDGWHEELYLKTGEKGWIMPQWPVEKGGAGFDRLSELLLRNEMQRAKFPYRQLSTVDLIVHAIDKHGSDELRAEVLEGIARGRIKVSLGYTEPHGGSDIAGARTRAMKDGSEWVINGSKMFTTSGHFADFTFLITRTDPDVAKHKGITMFFVPLKTEGVEVQGIRTFSGERTNMVFYDDVRIDDRYRVGPVNAGWTILREPLDAEHGLGGREDDGYDSLPIGANFLYEAQDAIHGVAGWANRAQASGARPADDPSVVDAVARATILFEASYSTNGAPGRILGAESCDAIGSILLDVLGPEGMIDPESGGANDGGWADFLHRYAQGTMTYGGSVEVFRTIIANLDLHLPRIEFPGSRTFLPAGTARS